MRRSTLRTRLSVLAGIAIGVMITQLDFNSQVEANWWWIHDLPMFDQLRFEPRYQAAVEEHERRVGLQRDAIEAMEMEAGL